MAKKIWLTTQDIYFYLAISSIENFDSIHKGKNMQELSTTDIDEVSGGLLPESSVGDTWGLG
jgi:hypothetical protein